MINISKINHLKFIDIMADIFKKPNCKPFFQPPPPPGHHHCRPNININISDYSNYNQKFMPIPKKFHDDIQEKISSVNNTYQKDKNLEKEMKGIMNIINDINDNQQIMAEEFKEVKSDIGTMSETLDTIRVTMMTDKKFKLKSLIYECLNAGFATPEQNDIITSEYHNYKALKGNGDIQELYEKHYIKLDVHD